MTNAHESSSPPLGVLLGDLALATRNLTGYDSTNHPTIVRVREAEAIQIATSIGEVDGSKPGIDEHSPRSILPSQDFIANSVEATIDLLGGQVNKAIELSREGQELSRPAPPEPIGFWKAVLSWISRLRLTLLIGISFGVIEYIVGIEWVQRVFSVSDSTAHIMALVMPTLTAAIAIIVAQSILSSAERHMKKAIFISAFFAFASVIAFGVGAGLVVSGKVQDFGFGSGGISGGAGAETLASDDGSAFAWVKYTIYASLLFGGFFATLAAHLHDLHKERLKEIREAAESARLAPSETEIAHGNIVYLQSFEHLYHSLIETRQSIINAYVAGVRGHLSQRISDTWDHQALSVDPPPPVWLARLEEEIKELDRVAKANLSQG